MRNLVRDYTESSYSDLQENLSRLGSHDDGTTDRGIASLRFLESAYDNHDTLSP